MNLDDMAHMADQERKREREEGIGPKAMVSITFDKWREQNAELEQLRAKVSLVDRKAENGYAECKRLHDIVDTQRKLLERCVDMVDEEDKRDEIRAHLRDKEEYCHCNPIDGCDCGKPTKLAATLADSEITDEIVAEQLKHSAFARADSAAPSEVANEIMEEKRSTTVAGREFVQDGNDLLFGDLAIRHLRQRIAELEAEVESMRSCAIYHQDEAERLREALEVAYKLPHLRAIQDHIQEALKGASDGQASTQAEVAQEDDTDGGEAVSAEAQNEAAAKTETKESLKPLKLLYPMSVIEWRNALMKRDAEIAQQIGANVAAVAEVRQEHADLAIWQFRAASEKGDQDRLIDKMHLHLDALTEAVLAVGNTVNTQLYLTASKNGVTEAMDKLREMKGGE